jgi:hypothetical protein
LSSSGSVFDGGAEGLLFMHLPFCTYYSAVG